MLTSMGTFDFEDGLRLSCRRLPTLVPSSILVPGVAAIFLCSVVLRHRCRRSGRGGRGVSILRRETLVNLIKMSYSLWT